MFAVICQSRSSKAEQKERERERERERENKNGKETEKRKEREQNKGGRERKEGSKGEFRMYRFQSHLILNHFTFPFTNFLLLFISFPLLIP